VRTLAATVAVVAALNLAYGAFEALAGWHTGSVALLADATDFFEDGALNLLILLGLGLGLGAAWRARLGSVIAALMLLPALGAAWSVWAQLSRGVVPDPWTMGLVSVGALAVNLLCATLLARHRGAGGSLPRAAWLSARNDAAGNAAVIGEAVLVFASGTHWPDLVVGVALVLLHGGAAWEVWTEARAEANTPRA
jgi:Co/Zn/Cd efflux system component